MANYMRRGGAYGDPRSQGFFSTYMVTVTSPSGVPFTVHRDAAPAFQGFLADLEAAGYQINPGMGSGGYNLRNIGGGKKISQHGFGNAIDINPDLNPVTYGAVKTNMPKNITQIAAKWGLEWGGNWRSKKDPMHFEWTGKPVAPGQGVMFAYADEKKTNTAPFDAVMGSPRRTLKKGMQGDDVKALQEALIARGADIRADGDFGRQTQAALRAYQKAEGLTVDGKAGRETFGRLFSSANPYADLQPPADMSFMPASFAGKEDAFGFGQPQPQTPLDQAFEWATQGAPPAPLQPAAGTPTAGYDMPRPAGGTPTAGYERFGQAATGLTTPSPMPRQAAGTPTHGYDLPFMPGGARSDVPGALPAAPQSAGLSRDYLPAATLMNVMGYTNPYDGSAPPQASATPAPDPLADRGTEGRRAFENTQLQAISDAKRAYAEQQAAAQPPPSYDPLSSARMPLPPPYDPLSSMRVPPPDPMVNFNATGGMAGMPGLGTKAAISGTVEDIRRDLEPIAGGGGVLGNIDRAVKDFWQQGVDGISDWGGNIAETAGQDWQKVSDWWNGAAQAAAPPAASAGDADQLLSSVDKYISSVPMPDLTQRIQRAAGVSSGGASGGENFSPVPSPGQPPYIPSIVLPPDPFSMSEQFDLGKPMGATEVSRDPVRVADASGGIPASAFPRDPMSVGNYPTVGIPETGFGFGAPGTYAGFGDLSFLDQPEATPVSPPVASPITPASVNAPGVTFADNPIIAGVPGSDFTYGKPVMASLDDMTQFAQPPAPPEPPAQEAAPLAAEAPLTPMGIVNNVWNWTKQKAGEVARGGAAYDSLQDLTNLGVTDLAFKNHTNVDGTNQSYVSGMMGNMPIGGYQTSGGQIFGWPMSGMYTSPSGNPFRNYASPGGFYDMFNPGLLNPGGMNPSTIV